jgi:hypothetical protein
MNLFTKWLLRDNPSLAGDLLEERSNGRGRAWYFRQLFVAVARSIVSGAREHPVLLARAAATAILSYLCFALLTAVVIGLLYGRFSHPEVWAKVDSYSFWIFAPMVTIPSLITGWLTVRTHRACASASVVAMIVLWAVSILPYPDWFGVAAMPALLAGALLEIWQYARSTQKGTS